MIQYANPLQDLNISINSLNSNNDNGSASLSLTLAESKLHVNWKGEIRLPAKLQSPELDSDHSILQDVQLWTKHQRHPFFNKTLLASSRGSALEGVSYVDPTSIPLWAYCGGAMNVYSRSSVTANFFEALYAAIGEDHESTMNSKVALLTRVVVPDTDEIENETSSRSQAMLPDYFMFSVEKEDIPIQTKLRLPDSTNSSSAAFKITAIPLQFSKSVYLDLLSTAQEEIKTEHPQTEQSRFLLPTNYKPGQPSSLSIPTIKKEDQSHDDDRGILGSRKRPQHPYFPGGGSSLRASSRASSISSTSTARDMFKQPFQNPITTTTNSSRRATLPPRISSTPGTTPTPIPLPASASTDTLDAKEKEALQHVILASLRLRGITRDPADNGEFYKELYHQTYTAARFALRQQKKVLSLGSSNSAVGKTVSASSTKRIGMMDMQDKVDKLLSMFVPEDLSTSAEGF